MKKMLLSFFCFMTLLFSVGCSVAAMNYQEETNQLPYGLQTAVTAFSAIYSLGSTT